MQDQPTYLADFAENKKRDALIALHLARCVEQQIAPILERLERLETALGLERSKRLNTTLDCVGSQTVAIDGIPR
jgi:hypothetical protein